MTARKRTGGSGQPLLPIVIPAAAALFLGLVYALYAKAMRCSDAQKQGSEEPPAGEQYVPWYPKVRELVAEMHRQSFEDVRIRSRDGLTLHARYLHVRDGAPVMIQMHGYRSAAMRDHCGANKIARENGINTLLTDQRAHGGSGGHTLTFGVRERYDVLDWIGWVRQRFGEDTEIWLAGISMGAATVLMTADLDLPENVKGILADSPYTSPEAIIRSVIRRSGLPDGAGFALIQLGARLFGHVSLKEASALRSVRKAKIPILLIHGTGDRFVPCAMSEELRDACASPVQLELFEGAAHGIGYLTDPARYERVVLEFLEKARGLSRKTEKHVTFPPPACPVNRETENVPAGQTG